MKKKKVTGIILALLICTVFVFTGCSLVTRNWDKYYNATVVTLITSDNTKIDISKRELMTAYSSYGYYYEQYYGYDKQEAVETTLTQLENRKLILKDAEDTFAKANGGEVLKDEEKTYLWQETNTALRENLLGYLEEEDADSNSDSATSNLDTVTKEEYEKQARPVIYGYIGDIPQYRIEKEKPVTNTLDDFLKTYDESKKKDFDNKDDKNQLYLNLISLVLSEDETYSDAFNEYFVALKESERGLNIKENRVIDVFTREIERVYKANYENYLLEKYSENLRREEDKYYSDVTPEKMIDFYIKKVVSSYKKYSNDTSGTYEEDVLEDVSKINYFKTGNATKFYYVAHILLKFNDDQTATYQKAVAVKDSRPDLYESYMKELKSQAKLLVRKADGDTYTETEERKPWEVASGDKTAVDNLYEHIKDTINGVNDADTKVSLFDDFIYTYNQDPGIMNAEYNYVMGLNKYQASENDEDTITVTVDGQEIKYKSYSKMVPEFTQAGAELYRDGQGQVGDLSDLVVTNNGFHILMYMGECQNIYSGIIDSYLNNEEINLDSSVVMKLDTIKLNLRSNKTLFDSLYEDLTVDNFATFESENQKLLRDDCKEIKYVSNYDDLFN